MSQQGEDHMFAFVLYDSCDTETFGQNCHRGES